LVQKPIPHHIDVDCKIQWPFGHGLSYSKFEYSNFAVSSQVINFKEPILHMTLLVTNKGPFVGSHTVLIYTFDESRHVTPETKLLRDFIKLDNMQVNQTTRIHSSISLDQLRFIGPHDDTYLILQDSLRFKIGVGNGIDCRKKKGSFYNLCSDFVTVETGRHYIDACEIACKIWEDDSECFNTALNKHGYQGEYIHKEICWDMCSSDAPLFGWGWNYVHCIQQVLYEHQGQNNTCDLMLTLCRDVFTAAIIRHNISIHEHNPTLLNVSSQDASIDEQTTVTKSQSSSNQNLSTLNLVIFILCGVSGSAVLVTLIVFFNRKRNSSSYTSDLEFTDVTHDETFV